MKRLFVHIFSGKRASKLKREWKYCVASHLFAIVSIISLFKDLKLVFGKLPLKTFLDFLLLKTYHIITS